MNIDNLAQAIFGRPRAESQEVSTNSTTRTYTGVATSDSADGTVMIDIGGDVTLPDDLYDEDGNVIAEYASEGIEVPTGPSVQEGDEVTVTLVGGGALKTPMVTSVSGEGDRQNERIHAIEADYVKASTLEADVADIGFLKADSATIKGLQADTAKVHDLTADQLSAATAYIASLNAKSVTAETLAADVAKVHDLTADQLSAAAAYIAQLAADSVTAQRIAAISGDFDTVRANAAKVANLTAAELEADHATIGTLDTTYMHADMANADVAWIQNGTIKNGAIVSAMINDVSANKLTAGTINGSVINVTNLNADNITAGTINGQRIGEGSLSLDKLSEDVYTETEVNNIVDGLNDRIDGAIETHTGTTVPTLNNQPASSWNTTKLRDEHVGDVYYVVNSQSQQNGYCYRFTKSGSTYSWQLIKDSDVTAALSRLTTAEGKITTFDSDISQLKTDTGTLTTKTTSLETRMSDAESDILDKVDTTTFNSLEDTVDGHTQTLSQHTTAISNKADSSTVTAVTNRVSKNEQDISGINTTIGELQETVESKADGSTVSTISNRLNTVSDTVDGHTQTLTSVQNTLSTKADSSTVSTLQTDYATFKQQTEQFESTVGTTYATKTELKGATDDITELEGRVSTNETSISNNASAIALKANSSDVYTKSGVDGLISTEVTNRNAAITAKANEITSTVSQTYTTKTEFDNLEIGGRNLALGTAGVIVDKTDLADGSRREYFSFDLGRALPFGAGTPIVISFDLYMVIKTADPALMVYNTNNNGPHKTLSAMNVLSGKDLVVGSVVDERIVIKTSVDSDRSNPTSPHDWLEFYSVYGSNNYYRISNLKLEKGNKATDWTPAPEDIETRVSSAESAITQNANNIALKVSESDVTGNYIVGKINLDSTTASIAAQHINLQGAVTISDLSSDAQSATLNSNISVGGRNLLTNTQANWKTGSLSNGVYSTYGNQICPTNGSQGTNFKIPIEPNTPYIVQGWSELTDYPTLFVGVHQLDENLTFLNDSSWRQITGAGYSFTSLSNAAYVRVTFKEQAYTAAGASAVVSAMGDSVRIKFEKGNIATDWTPAPEDTPDQMTWYGTCSTAASTSAKVVTCDGFELQTGARITVKFTHINTTNAPTLDVNGTGAIATWYNDAVSSSSNPIRWGANATLNFIYDGSAWVLDERPPSYSATCSTSAATRLKTPSVVGALVVNGTRLSVRFSTANTYTDNAVQISLASTGAYNIYQNNELTSTTNPLLWDANTILTFVAQGTSWHLLSRSDAYKTATSYVTEITGQNGIMVHPSTDQTTGVQITSDVDILRDGTSVAEYGETVRIGAEGSDHVAIDSNELMFHDGTNAVMQVGGSCQITEKHVCGSSTSEEVFYLSLEPSDGSKFRVIDKNGEIVTSNYTLTRYDAPDEKRRMLKNKSGTALDGETVLVFYQSSGMVLYDDGTVSSTFTTDQASLAGGMFEMSYKDTYSSEDGTLTDSTAEIKMGEHRDQHSSISLVTTPNYNRSYMTFQVRGNGSAAFVLDSGSNANPDRVLDLIYLDRINYADPYGSGDRQLGKPTRLTASGSYKAGTNDTRGPSVTLTAGIWLVHGIWSFTNSSSSSKRLVVGLYSSSTGNAFTWRIHTTAPSNSAHRLEVSDTIVVSAASETVTLYGASSPASTSAATQFITAVRLA